MLSNLIAYNDPFRDWKTMKCVSCGGVLEISNDLKSARCKTCSLEYSSEALATLKERNGISAENGDRVEKRNNTPTVEPTLTEQINKAYETVRPSVKTKTIQSNQLSEKTEDEPHAPALKNWKTSIGFSILGIFTAAALNSLVSIESNWIFINVIYLISTVVYAVGFYPRLFGEKPPATSYKTISFWNWFFGGYLFGAIWNHNLTRKKKGVSNIVFTVYIIVISVTAVAMIIVALSVNPLTRINGGELDESQNRWTYTYKTVLGETNGLYKQNTISAKDDCVSALTEMGLPENDAMRIWVELESSTPTSTRDYDDVVNYLATGLNPNASNPSLMQVPIARGESVFVVKHEEIRKAYFALLNKYYVLMLMTVSDDKFGDEGYTIAIQFLY